MKLELLRWTYHAFKSNEYYADYNWHLIGIISIVNNSSVW